MDGICDLLMAYEMGQTHATTRFFGCREVLPSKSLGIYIYTVNHDESAEGDWFRVGT